MTIQTPGRIARTLLAAMLALALCAASAGAAPDPDGHRAGEDERIRAKGGTAWFFHHGEIVKVQDTRRDGLGVRAYLIGVGTTVVEDRGAGGKPRSKNLSIPDGQRVEIALCYFDKAGNQVDCSERQSAVS
jgi:hypothetical protein